MHVHLDAVGGAAGDMFAAAMVDACPDYIEAVETAVRALGLGDRVAIAFVPHSDGVLRGRRFRVTCPAPPHATPADVVREWIARASLARAVRMRALDILALLTEAEAEVHGIPVTEVAFHELGGLDTPVDLVAAAALIEAAGSPSWSCGALPRGRGMVRTEHGMLPVPAPATVRLLDGMVLVDDGVEGERITPTGAAILHHLAPEQAADFVPRRLRATGHGFGSSTFEGRSNVLRAQFYAPLAENLETDRVAVLTFEVDDQSPEDLAVGLERLRTADGVLDVSQHAVGGKDSRLAVRVQVLASPDQAHAVSTQCFRETTTLGLRWTLTDRLLLPRAMMTTDGAGHSIRVKVATRPGGGRTAKAELADLRAAGVGQAGRAELRAEAERQALDDLHEDPVGSERDHDND